MDEDDRLALRELVRLAAEGTEGAADVVETMHARISPLGGRRADGGRVRARGISGLVYGGTRGITRGVAMLLGRALGFWPRGARRADSPASHALRAALNGVSGHHLAATANPLAIPMSLRSAGRRLTLEREAIRTALPDAGGRVLVLIHGLCMNDLQWRRRGHDHGAALAADLGYTPLYLRYNTGLHVWQNGRALASLLERLVEEWPHPSAEVALLCHSMGGLVARSALHHAEREGMRWPSAVRRLVFLGTPHHGSPLERAGNRLHRAFLATRITAPLARLGAIRSAGITDLRHGSLTDADCDPSDRFAAHHPGPRAVPLPAGVDCFSIAATRGLRGGDLRDRLLGDGLVPVRSALGRGGEADLGVDPSREWVGYGMGHLDLLSHPEVYRRIHGWLSGPGGPHPAA
ncbi:MAG TPA: alpha/beta hydrolase [Longimicrobium sp.]|nr:alpha/beta hydrolase [Longimicrobium sp.]